MGNNDTLKKEQRFAAVLEQVKRTARENGGTITEEEILDCFSEFELSRDQMDSVYAYLQAAHIGIGEPSDAEENLSEEDHRTLDLYLEELELLPVFTDGQKKAAIMSAMAGDKDAQDKLVEMYLQSVVDVAKLYSGQGVLLEDLIGEGNVALAVGVTMLGSQENPDECEGVLMKLVMDAMEELIAENSQSDDVMKKALERVNKVNDKAIKLEEELGRKVTVSELAELEGLSVKAILDAIRISGKNIDSIEVLPDESDNI